MYLDLLLLFVVLILMLIGYIQGFMRQIFSLISLVAILLFAHPLALWLKESAGFIWFSNAPVFVLWGMSALAIFLFMMGLEAVVLMTKKDSSLVPMDRWLGTCFGAAKGLLLALALSVLFHILPERTRNHFGDFQADGKGSFFVKASSSVLQWKALSSVRGLQEIRDGLTDRIQEKGKAFDHREGPWALDDENDDSETY